MNYSKYMMIEYTVMDMLFLITASGFGGIKIRMVIP